jgi:DNA-binding response OmpR family regulator
MDARSQPARSAPPAVDVLLVEDDEVLCVLLAHALRARDLAVDVAADTIEAKRLLSRNVYKVALIDLLLDDGSGHDVIGFIRSSGLPRMHSVVITAADPSSLGALDRSIVKTVFFKPFNVEHLAAYVQTLAR